MKDELIRKELIITDIPELHKKSDFLLKSLDYPGSPIFQKEGHLVRILDYKTLKMELLTRYGLKHEASKIIKWLKYDERREKLIEISPPMEVIQDAIAHPIYPISEIEGISGHPVFNIDGTIVYQNGYDQATKYYIKTDKSIQDEIESISDNPGMEERQKAVEFIQDFISDFPFLDKSDFANILSLLLTLLCRNIIDGPVPIFIITSPSPGTGKSLLASVILLILTGKKPAITSWPKSEDEFNKVILPTFLQGYEYFLFDNIKEKIKSGSLAAIITSEQYRGRILGESKIMHVPVKSIFILTANNPELDKELARRCVPIRLIVNMENPAARTNFKYNDLPQVIMNNRALLLKSVFTIIKGWFADGKKSEQVKALGSFEGWSKTIGSILKSCGISGFLENTDEFFNTADEDYTNWKEFICSWYENFKDEKVQAGDLIHIAIETGILDDKKSMASGKKSLGKLISGKHNVVFNDLQIIRAGISHHVQLWRIVYIGK
jgi:hypothetical protein